MYYKYLFCFALLFFPKVTNKLKLQRKKGKENDDWWFLPALYDNKPTSNKLPLRFLLFSQCNKLAFCKGEFIILYVYYVEINNPSVYYVGIDILNACTTRKLTNFGWEC